MIFSICVLFFFFNDTATTEIYTLSLHDALPISGGGGARSRGRRARFPGACAGDRSEEHTSELQSPPDIVCRLLLEKKKNEQCIREVDTAAEGQPMQRRECGGT